MPGRMGIRIVLCRNAGLDRCRSRASAEILGIVQTLVAGSTSVGVDLSAGECRPASTLENSYGNADDSQVCHAHGRCGIV